MVLGPVLHRLASEASSLTRTTRSQHPLRCRCVRSVQGVRHEGHAGARQGSVARQCKALAGVHGLYQACHATRPALRMRQHPVISACYLPSAAYSALLPVPWAPVIAAAPLLALRSTHAWWGAWGSARQRLGPPGSRCTPTQRASSSTTQKVAGKGQGLSYRTAGGQVRLLGL